MKRGSYLFVAYSVGKWTQETCRRMMEKLFRSVELPYPDNRIEVFSDGNTDYGHVLPDYCIEPCIDYGQLIKIREGGRVVDKKKRVVMGSPELRDIETTNVENFNGILRERLGRLVRKTKCYSKKRRRLESALELIQFHWNTMHVIKGGSTPGMIESLTDHVWDWDEFLMYHYAV